MDDLIKTRLAFIFILICSLLFLINMKTKLQHDREEMLCKHLGGRLARLDGQYRCIKKEIFNEVFIDLRRKNEAQ